MLETNKTRKTQHNKTNKQVDCSLWLITCTNTFDYDGHFTHVLLSWMRLITETVPVMNACVDMIMPWIRVIAVAE